MKITISGHAGSGKTSVSKELAKNIGFKVISVGSIFRDLAKEANMTLEEFSLFAEKNRKIDSLIDEQQVELSNKYRDCIIEGRLSGWMIEADIKIWLRSSIETRIRRIIERENRDYEDILKETISRERIEKERYKKFYNIDIDDLSIYDLVINSERWDVVGVSEIILKGLERLKNGKDRRVFKEGGNKP
ncbi:MAG: cytidylate kinase [Candidatus Methanoliparum thermophilum]|uniref:Cytidylate kinase n=1 Tax=Methanoliparum thermophilum TaxID=2491083 RepID=A0A520KTT7_METT2|nr:AAA family ATPase [Candidatus Methanoliparum sp. LAM-1]RZN65504.1 MAG: cytidylate kinase [Candidatus Methanoliparum thermophilum]BDC35401.1 cytidylate kinase [Candidatus Methanoliparum sp. LAM-1]